MSLRPLLWLLLAGGLPGSAHAQAPPAELRTRMDAFAAALREQAPMEEIAAFFSSRGTWEMVRRPHGSAPGARVGRHRFAPEHTLAAIREGGPVCDSFGGVIGDVGPYEGTVVMQVHDAGRPWRYVGRNRFVPADLAAGSPVFVEWTREGTAWVIVRIGEEYWPAPRVLYAAPANPVVRGAGTAAAEGYAAPARWYLEHDPISLDRRRYVKYGQPRRLAADELSPVGALHGVPVLRERGVGSSPDVLYVRVAPGEYQPYEGFGHSICRE